MRTYKILTIIITAVIAGVTLTGCGGSKPLSQETATGFQKIEKDECQLKAEEQPVKRAYGTGQHFKEMTARNIAETQARAQFARMIASLIIASTSEDANANTAYNGDISGANTVEQQNAGARDFATSIANEEIRNSTIISTCPTFNPTTKQYKVAVCVEYNENIATMANNITKKIQKLSDEQKLQMNFEFEQYRKRIEAELEKMNKQ
ncbi:MAG: hypothetical protein LBR65_08965 [Culturomica sp.]|jgi:molecular chaperone GrpE (heat shock protein)|nr:hypothetical protein [Culturomica sp.]